MVGLALFAVASVIVAMAHGPAFLLAGRALQGLAAALAVPGTLAAISEVQFAGAPRIGDRRLGRFPDAGLQSRSADRRSAHPLRRLARDLLGQRRQHARSPPGASLVSESAAATSRARRLGRFDWAGFVLLAIFMAALISALQALPAVTRAPLDLPGLCRTGGRCVRRAVGGGAPRPGPAHRPEPVRRRRLRARHRASARSRCRASWHCCCSTIWTRRARPAWG